VLTHSLDNPAGCPHDHTGRDYDARSLFLSDMDPKKKGPKGAAA
jgi:hypothetical protein